MPHSGFNPNARWDRHIPETESSAPEELNETIEVLALFKGGKIYPRQLLWNAKSYKIKKINYNWQEHLGQTLISCFSIDTGSDLYQISFNHTSCGWRIDKIIE